MKDTKNITPTSIRITAELKQWIQHKAIDNYRSFNSEIVARLDASRKAEEVQHEKHA